jgi:hypothetical protein
MGRVSGGSGIRLACLLLAFLAAPTAATLTKINNVDPTSLAETFNWADAGVLIEDSFNTPLGPFSQVGGLTQVTVRAEAGNPKTFQVLQQPNSWLGGMPAGMVVIYTFGEGNVKLEFNPPISAFATYIDVSDHCHMRCTEAGYI